MGLGLGLGFRVGARVMVRVRVRVGVKVRVLRYLTRLGVYQSVSLSVWSELGLG